MVAKGWLGDSAARLLGCSALAYRFEASQCRLSAASVRASLCRVRNAVPPVVCARARRLAL